MEWPTLNASLGDTPNVLLKAQQQGDSQDKPTEPEPAVSSADFLQDAPSDAEDEESPHEKSLSNFDIRLQRQNLPRLDTNFRASRDLRATKTDPISPIIDPKAINKHSTLASPNLSGPSVSED